MRGSFSLSILNCAKKEIFPREAVLATEFRVICSHCLAGILETRSLIQTKSDWKSFPKTVEVKWKQWLQMWCSEVNLLPSLSPSCWNSMILKRSFWKYAVPSYIKYWSLELSFKYLIRILDLLAMSNEWKRKKKCIRKISIQTSVQQNHYRPVGFPGLMMQRTFGWQYALASFKERRSSFTSRDQQFSSSK